MKKSTDNRLWLFLRLAICVLILFGVTFPSFKLPAKKIDHLLLIDSSYSMKVYRHNLEQIIEDYRLKHDHDSYQVLYFSNGINEGDLSDHFDQGHVTDLDKTFKEIRLMYDGTSRLEIDLVTDGKITELLPSSVDIPKEWAIHCIPMVNQKPLDVSIESLRILDTDPLNKDHVKGIQLAYSSTIEGPCNLIIASGSTTLYEGICQLRQGQHSLQLVCDFVKDKGPLRGQVHVDGDTNPHNNIGYVIHEEGPTTKYLVISNDPQPKGLKSLLSYGQINYQIIEPQQVFGQTLSNLDYDGFILDNCSGDDFTHEGIHLIDQVVSQQGKALFVIGGDQSFGLGSYADSGLERLLPVEDALSGPEQEGNSSLVIVLDTSGSMEDTAFGTKKITMAKSGVQAVINQLHPDDTFGLIGFSDVYEWLQPLEAVSNLETIDHTFIDVGAKGGTLIKPSLVKAYEALSVLETNKEKHILLITDGQGEQEGYDDLLTQIIDKNISLSCIGIGDDIADDFLEQLSTLGEGAFYQVDDIRNLPEIMVRNLYENVKETLQIGKFPVVDSETSPYETGKPTTISQYVATTAKENAKVRLTINHYDPLLVTQGYGIGNVGVYTSNLSTGWSGDYLINGGSDLLVETLKSLPLETRDDAFYLTVEGNRLTIDHRDPQVTSFKIVENGTVLEELTSLTGHSLVYAFSNFEGQLQVNGYDQDQELVASNSILVNYSAEHKINDRPLWRSHPEIFTKDPSADPRRSLKSIYVIWPLICMLFILSVYYRGK